MGFFMIVLLIAEIVVGVIAVLLQENVSIYFKERSFNWPVGVVIVSDAAIFLNLPYRCVSVDFSLGLLSTFCKFFFNLKLEICKFNLHT